MSDLETTTNAPRRIEVLLQSLGADREFVDDVLGDLAEEFALRSRWDGVAAARRWYYAEALRTAPHLLRDWRRRFGLGDAARVLGASLIGLVTDTLFANLFAQGTFWVTGIPLGAYIHHWQTTGDLMPWLAVLLVGRQILPAMVAGFIAGALGKRAALPYSILTAGGIILAATIRAVQHAMPARLIAIGLVVDGGSLVASCVAGGVAAAFWHASSSNRRQSFAGR